MRDLDSILRDKFPSTEERIEGCLVYLTSYGLTKLSYPILQELLGLEFCKARFSTGYRKFSIIDVIIGFQTVNKYIGLLTNPLFSDKYSDLPGFIESVPEADISQQLINEIIELYKEVGATITEIDKKDSLYQIWLGGHKWRLLKIGKSRHLTIKTTPNRGLQQVAHDGRAMSFWASLYTKLVRPLLKGD